MQWQYKASELTLNRNDKDNKETKSYDSYDILDGFIE
jgi:hypothetical protein